MPPYLTNESPASSGTASVQTNVAFTVTDDTVPVDKSTIEVTIGGTVAYNGTSGFQLDYQGPASSILENGRGFDVVVDPETDFDVDSNVAVNVKADNDNAESLDTTYDFDTYASALQVAARYIESGDLIQVDIYLYEATSQVLRGSSIDTGSVVIRSRGVDIQTIEFAGGMADSEGIIHCFFVHPPEVTELTTYTELTTVNSVALTRTVDVLTEESMSTSSGGSIPFTSNLNKSTDETPPRTIHVSSAVLSQQIKEAPYEDVVEDPIITNELMELDFGIPYDYIASGIGTLSYTGGGHRLLPLIATPASFVAQDPDDIPNDLLGRQLVEEGSINKLPNSQFLLSTSDVPDGYSWADVDHVIIQPDIGAFVASSANYMKTVLTGLKPEYTGDISARFDCEEPITIDPTDPVTLSMLAKTERRDTGTKVSNMILNVEFYTGSTLLTTRTATYDPETLELDDYALIELVTPVASVPPTTDNIRWFITLGSIDGGDEMTLYLTCPQVEAKDFSSSRILGERTRSDDTLTFPQGDNIELAQGRFIFSFVPYYDGTPLADATLFDTREPGTLNKGFVAIHQADGFITFNIVDDAGGITAVTSTAAQSFPVGEPQTLTFAWDSSNLNIYLGEDETEIGALTGAYTQPTGKNVRMRFGADVDGNGYLNSEILSFSILREYE